MACTFLQKGGHYILWSHLTELHDKSQQDSGLYIGKKLTREHTHLTPYSRMRVDLAAQVYTLCIYMHCAVWM